MGIQLLSLKDSNPEVKYSWLVAMSILNTISTIALFVFILGLLITSGSLFLLSAIVLCGGIVFSIFVYKRNVNKMFEIPRVLGIPPPPPKKAPEIRKTKEEWQKELQEEVEPEPETKPEEEVEKSLLG